jgi:hypothetical protein
MIHLTGKMREESSNLCKFLAGHQWYFDLLPNFMPGKIVG